MTGLRFEVQAPVVESDPNRTDVACFVGLVRRRPEAPVPAAIRDWLSRRGWTGMPWAREPIEDLADVPVPIDTWEVFDHLFAWEEREPSAPAFGSGTYLGAAVRSFFAQGGRKCYLVRVADPPPLAADVAQRRSWLELLVPSPGPWAASPTDRKTWRGTGHLYGLPDVSFLVLPDLADLVRVDRPLPDLRPPAGARPKERFVECSRPRVAAPADGAARRLAAPRCDTDGYRAWAAAVRRVADLLALPGRPQREVQLVASLPLPAEPDLFPDPDPPATDLFGFLHRQGCLSEPAGAGSAGLASAFVQLAYPWVRTPGSYNLPAGLESPDAVLAGLLARNALTRGTFRSAAGLRPGDVEALEPALERSQIHGPRHGGKGFGERVSLFGRRPGAFELASDVTASLDEVYRPAAVGRLVATILRAARRLGEDLTFESSGEVLWTRLRRSLRSLMAALLEAGALAGATPEQAFSVRCDRSTMSRHDVDQGRVIAEVTFSAALPIDTITVVLAMDEGGRISLAGAPGRQAA